MVKLQITNTTPTATTNSNNSFILYTLDPIESCICH